MTRTVKIIKAVVCPFHGLVSPIKCTDHCSHFKGMDISANTIACEYRGNE